MNKIERVRAVLRGDAVDRVPAGFWFHFAPAYRGGEAMAQAHLDYYRATDLDILKVMNDTGYAPIGRVIVRQPRDWLTLEPTPLSDPLFQSHLEGLKRIVEAVGREVLVMTTAFNPFHQAVAILQASLQAQGIEGDARALFVRQVREEPEPLLRGLQVIAEDSARFFRACITEAGANGIYYSAQGGERTLMTDAEHAQAVKAFDLYVLRQINEVAEFTVGHFCGRGLALERFVDYPVSLVIWAYQADNPSLREGRALFGGKPILGGMDERGPIVTGPREAIRREIQAALEALGTRGFMLGAGCTVPSDIPWANLIAAREEVAALSRAAAN